MIPFTHYISFVISLKWHTVLKSVFTWTQERIRSFSVKMYPFYMLPTQTVWNTDESQASRGIMSILSAFKHGVKVKEHPIACLWSADVFPGLVPKCHRSVLRIKEVRWRLSGTLQRSRCMSGTKLPVTPSAHAQPKTPLFFARDLLEKKKKKLENCEF